MSAVEALRGNDPETRPIYIWLRNESSDSDLAQALQQNPFVRCIAIVFMGTNINDWPLLQQVIETKENLTSVLLVCSPVIPSADALVLPFLEAAHTNAAVEEIRLSVFRFVPGSEVFNFLCNTDFGEKMLAFYYCDMVDPSQREQVARALAAANIKRLKIRYCNDDHVGTEEFSSALLRNLGQHAPILTDLNLDLDFDSPCDEIAQFLQDTKTLQRFHLKCVSESQASTAALRQCLLCAIKKNFSLRVVAASFYPDRISLARPLFGDQETGQAQRLEFYLNRNERLEEWIENPVLVGQEVWPEALSLAQQAGPGALFKSLRSVLGKDYVKVSTSGKKRKRPKL